MDEKIKIEKSILFDKCFSDVAKVILDSHKKNPSPKTAKLVSHLIKFRGYVAGLENDIFVMNDILKKYRHELRERDSKNKVL
jgi:hypothetical protein